jgi:mevalonate kinase
MKLKISAKTLTIGDVIAAEEGFKTNRQIIEFLARFVVDDDGAPVDSTEAVKQIMALPVAELPDLVRQLQEAIQGIQESAVPLGTSES